MSDRNRNGGANDAGSNARAKALFSPMVVVRPNFSKAVSFATSGHNQPRSGKEDCHENCQDDRDLVSARGCAAFRRAVRVQRVDGGCDNEREVLCQHQITCHEAPPRARPAPRTTHSCSLTRALMSTQHHFVHLFGVPTIQPVIGAAHRALGPLAKNESMGEMPALHTLAVGASVSVAFGVVDTGNLTASTCGARRARGSS